MHALEVGVGAVEVEVGVDGVAAGLAQENVFGLVLVEDVEDDFGGPLEFADGFLFAKEVAIDHQAGLGGVAEMVFEKVGAREGFV